MISSNGSAHTAHYPSTSNYGYFEGRRSDGVRGFYIGYGNGSTVTNLRLDNASRLDITGGNVYMSGNLGLGTTSAVKKLHIEGKALINSDSYDPLVINTYTRGGGVNIHPND